MKELNHVQNQGHWWNTRDWFVEIERGRRITKLVYANWINGFDQPRSARPPFAVEALRLLPLNPNQKNSPKLLLPATIEQWFNSRPLESLEWYISSRWFTSPVTPVFLASILPSIEIFDNALTNEQTRQAALVLNLALQIHHRRHGEFPETLEALLGNGIDKLPIDPYGKGEPIRYRREANPADGAVIWSVAEDGIDQDGKIDWDRGQQPGDFIFKIKPPRIPEQ